MTFGLPLKKSRGMAKNQLEISQRASLDLESIAIVTIQHWGKQQSRKYKNSLAAALSLFREVHILENHATLVLLEGLSANRTLSITCIKKRTIMS